MSQPIFYFNKLNLWDKITITLYIFLTIGLGYYFVYTSNYEAKRDILSIYALGTQIFFYFFNYKSLRNLNVYFFWITVGLLHLFLYYQLREIPMLQNMRGHSATGLRNTIILLFHFQVLRFISAKTQGQELVCPSRGSRTDLFDERRVTFIDFGLFAIYFLATVVLLVKD